MRIASFPFFTFLRSSNCGNGLCEQSHIPVFQAFTNNMSEPLYEFLRTKFTAKPTVMLHADEEAAQPLLPPKSNEEYVVHTFQSNANLS